MIDTNNGSTQNFPQDHSTNNNTNSESQFQPDGSYHYRYSTQTPNNDMGQFGSPQKPKNKKSKSGPPWYVKLIAGVAACAVVSAGSIGGFVALVNAGVVTLNAPSQSTATGTVSTSSSVQQVSKNNSDGALTLQEVAAKVTPSVVCIQNYQGNRISETKAGEGSGIIMTSDGYIITNEHVVDGATSLKVVLYDGTIYDAKLIGSDTATDLALIKIEANDLTAATFGDADELSVGDQMVAIGNPGGITLNSSVTFGYVSALNRSIQTNNGYTVNCIQTDAAINPGNSGGALVNVYGQVVGINSSKIAATGYEGLGFAISINEALPIIESIKEYGYVKDRPMVGISYQFIDESIAPYYNLPVGLIIASVNTENAKKAGLERGDVITKMDETSVDSTSVIAKVLGDKKPGDTIILEVYKASSKKTVTMSLTLSEYSVANS